MIKIKELMIIERFLLEINNKIKFELSFNDNIKLYEYSKEIGRITNLYFLLQEEFHEKINDTEKLKEYHSKLLNEDIDFNYENVIKFIEKIYNETNNDELKNIVDKNRFWN